MDRELEIETELQSLGLSRKTWPEVLKSIQAKLSQSDWEKFSRLHKNFVGYRSEDTLSRFYGFVFSHGLQWELNGFRYARLVSILEDLLTEIPPGISILDIGAGAGVIASILQRKCAPRSLVVQDSCLQVREALMAQGFTVLSHPPPQTTGVFDLLLCVDSLGEINSDDDHALAEPEGIDAGEMMAMLEERYGFIQKLRAWLPYLVPGGRILIWEPFTYQNAMASLVKACNDQGWETQAHRPAPGRNYLELKPS